MTIEQAKTTYPIYSIRSQAGDTLISICDRIYKSRDSIYLFCLTALNEFGTAYTDWYELPLHTKIEYFDKSVCQAIYEITY